MADLTKPNSATSVKRVLISARQLGLKTGIPERTARRLFQEGKLKEITATKGGHWRIPYPLSRQNIRTVRMVKLYASERRELGKKTRASIGFDGDFREEVALWIFNAILNECSLDEAVVPAVEYGVGTDAKRPPKSHRAAEDFRIFERKVRDARDDEAASDLLPLIAAEKYVSQPDVDRQSARKEVLDLLVACFDLQRRELERWLKRFEKNLYSALIKWR